MTRDIWYNMGRVERIAYVLGHVVCAFALIAVVVSTI